MFTKRTGKWGDSWFVASLDDDNANLPVELLLESNNMRKLEILNDLHKGDMVILKNEYPHMSYSPDRKPDAIFVEGIYPHHIVLRLEYQDGSFCESISNSTLISTNISISKAENRSVIR